MPGRAGQQTREHPDQSRRNPPHHKAATEALLSTFRFYPPGAGVSMSRRTMRLMHLAAFDDGIEIPEKYADDETLESLRLPIPGPMLAARFGLPLPHHLAGKSSPCLGRGDDPYGLPAPSLLLYRCGLVGFPLSSRLPWLADLADIEAQRLFALIVVLRLDRLGASLASRAASLAVLWLLACLASSNAPRNGQAAGDEEPPPPEPPRAPGVDPFGLFVPRC